MRTDASHSKITPRCTGCNGSGDCQADGHVIKYVLDGQGQPTAPPENDRTEDHPDSKFGNVKEYKEGWHLAPSVLKRPVVKLKRILIVPC